MIFNTASSSSISSGGGGVDQIDETSVSSDL